MAPARPTNAFPTDVPALLPALQGKIFDGRPAGVTGSIDHRSSGGLSSTLGTAATSFALWGALCALALVARRVAISAWRDAPRRRRALSLR